MPSDSVWVALISATAVVAAPLLLAWVNHTLKQRERERGAARGAVAYWRARATKAERTLRGQRQRRRIKRRSQHSR